MDKKMNRNYNVGYAKPPKATQFKRGKSGNPAGRPKGSKNYMTVLITAAKEKITVTINGRPQRISKFEAICKQIMNNALKGDARAQRQVFDLMAREDSRAAAIQLAKEEKNPINVIVSPIDLEL